MVNSRIIYWLFLTSNLFYNLAQADLIEKIEYTYYGFTPKNGQSLSDSAFAVTPNREEDGKKYLGYTHWDIRWDYRYETKKRSCYLTNYTVTFTATVTLPRLKNSTDKLNKIFQSYLPNLKRHEDNHVQISLQEAKNLNYALQSISPQSSCEQLTKMINSIGYQHVNFAKQKNQQYDNKTQHGAIEGAQLSDYHH